MHDFRIDWTSAAPAGRLASRGSARSVDIALAALIRQGGGITTAGRTRAAGVSRHSILRRLESQTLVEVFDGVYAYPQDRLESRTRRRAAVLSCGEDAVLFAWSAAEHWRLITFQRPPDGTVHVAVPLQRRPRRAGITVHRLETLDPRDVTTRDGARVANIPRTLLDIGGTHGRRLVERLLDEAAYLGLWRRWEAEELLARANGHRGVAVLRAVLEHHRPGTTRTENEMEEAFLAISDRQGWPRPICQLPATLPTGRRIRHDFIWPDLRFIVETDGGRGHAGEHRRQRDAERDRLLKAAGYGLVRVRWDDVFHRPVVVVAAVEPALRKRLDAS